MVSQLANFKPIFVLVVLLKLFWYSNAETVSGLVTKIPLGCSDTSNQVKCSETPCGSNCVECDSQKICRVCSYGYFLYNTPERTVDCIQCPGYDTSSTDLENVYQCGTCLEMPHIWQNERKCSNRYGFGASVTTAENLLNKTIVTPVYYYIRANDPNVTQGQAYSYSRQKNSYYVDQTEDYCGGYQYDNYLPQQDVTVEDLDARMKKYNKARCNSCNAGKSWNATRKICESCTKWGEKCSQCTQFECTGCQDGYNLRYDFWSGQSECITCNINAHCLTCDPWDENFCYSCSDGYEMEVFEWFDQGQQTWIQEPSGRCYAAQKCSYTDENSDPNIKEYFCWDCYNDLWRQAEENNNWAIASSCFECQISGSAPTFTYTCKQACPPTFGMNLESQQCESCSNIDSNCKSCFLRDPNQNNSDHCYDCISPKQYDGQTSSCVNPPAVTTEILNCQNAIYNEYFLKTIENTDNQSTFYQLKEDLYKNTKSLCTVCNNYTYPPAAWHVTRNGNVQWQLFSSLDLAGRKCKPVPRYCRYSLAYLNERSYKSINPYLVKTPDIINPDNAADNDKSTTTFRGNMGECMGICASADQNDVVVGEQYFFDPLSKRCGFCSPNDGIEGKCRKKVVVQYWLQCDGQQSETNTHADIISQVAWANMHKMTDNRFFESYADIDTGEIDLTKNLNEDDYQYFDMNLIQHFEFKINFMVSNKTEGTKCFYQFDFWKEHIISNKIPFRVFRTTEVKLTFDTYNYVTGEKNTRNAIVGVTNERFQIKYFKTVEFNGLTFQYPSGQIDKNSERAVIELSDLMPGASLKIVNCAIFSKYTAVTWQITDLTSLYIQNFQFDSIKAFDVKVGFPLFQFIQQESYNKKFILSVQNLKLTGFIFNEVNLFEIPLRDAEVTINNVQILNSIFKQSYFLKDTYAGVESPLKEIRVHNILVNDTMFTQQSGIIKLQAVNYFEMKNTTIINSKFFSALTDNVNSVIESNVMQLTNLTFSDNTFQNFTILNQVSERIQVQYLRYNNFIKQFNIEQITVSQPDYMVMINLLTPIEFIFEDFHLYNLTSFNSTNNQYPFDIKFYSEVSTRKIFDRVDYVQRSVPGHKPVVDAILEDDEEFIASGGSQEIIFCDFGYNQDNSCWEPNRDLADHCFKDQVNWEWLDDLSQATSISICFNFFGEEVPIENVPTSGQKEEPFSQENPLLKQQELERDWPSCDQEDPQEGFCPDDLVFPNCDWGNPTLAKCPAHAVNLFPSCDFDKPIDGECPQEAFDNFPECNFDAPFDGVCPMGTVQAAYPNCDFSVPPEQRSGSTCPLDPYRNCDPQNPTIELCQFNIVYPDCNLDYPEPGKCPNEKIAEQYREQIANPEQPIIPNANQMLTFMKISYSRSSPLSKLNVTNFKIEYLSNINVLQVSDVDYVHVQNFTCAGNKNNTLLTTTCLQVRALQLERTESFEIYNSTLQYLYAVNNPIYIFGPMQILLNGMNVHDIYLLRDSFTQSSIVVEKMAVQQNVTLINSKFEHIAILDYNQEYSAQSAPIASIQSRIITVKNITSYFTVSFYSTSGLYLQSVTVNVVESHFDSSNYPLKEHMPEPACQVYNVTQRNHTHPQSHRLDNKGDTVLGKVPVQYLWYPRNNSCPFVSEFISNPDLPKQPGHKSCIDNYLYKLSFKYYNQYLVNGTTSLREYLSLGPRISTEGFLYVNQYKNMNLNNTVFSKHIYADSLVKLHSEYKGSTNITDVYGENLYPNFRKENPGSAGVFQYTGTKIHNFTLSNSTFSRTVSRIKGGILSYYSDSPDMQRLNLTHLNITDTYALQGGAFNIKGLDNEKCIVNMTDIYMNNTKVFYESQSNTARKFDDPEEDIQILLSAIKWPVDEEKLSTQKCLNLTVQYNKQKDAALQLEQAEKQKATLTQINFATDGCYKKDGTHTTDVAYCEAYYVKDFSLDACYTKEQTNPQQITGIYCQVYYILHSKYYEHGNCFTHENTPLETVQECTNYIQNTNFDDIGFCYVERDNKIEDAQACKYYYQNFANFDVDGGCNNLQGQWVSDVEQCNLIYFKANLGEGCFNNLGVQITDPNWCNLYYYGEIQTNPGSSQPPAELSGIYWQDGGCYDDQEPPNWNGDPNWCEDHFGKQDKLPSLFDLMSGCYDNTQTWVSSTQYCHDTYGYKPATEEETQIVNDGGCQGPDGNQIDDVLQCIEILHTEVKKVVTGNPTDDGGCYDWEENWVEDPDWCIDNDLASDEYYAELEKNKSNTDETVATIAGTVIVTDQLLETAQQTQALIYLEQITAYLDKFNVSQVYNQSAIVVLNSHVNITNSTFSNQTCNEYCQGTVKLLTSDFNLTGVNFTHNANSKGGGIHIGDNYMNIVGDYAGQYANRTISNCTFMNNNATIGAGIYIELAAADILDSYFEGNNASIKGGGLYAKLQIQQNTTSNTATTRRYLTSQQFKEQYIRVNNDTYLNNQTKRILTYKEYDNEWRRHLQTTNAYQTNVANSKVTKNYGKVGGGVNYEGQQVHFRSNADKALISGNQANVQGSESADIVEGCNYGEAQNNQGLCEECPAGKYTLDINAEECKSCPIGADCPGGSQIFTKKGYWRPGKFSDAVSSCRNLPENCVGGFEAGDTLCFDGHIGALCESCDVEKRYWPVAWSNSEPFKCGECAKVSGNAMKVALMNIWILTTMLLSVKETINMIQQQVMKNTLTILLGLNDIDFDEAGVLIKIFTNYFQIVSVISTFRLETPPGFVTVSSVAGNPVQQMGYSLDCFLVTVQKEMPFIYFRLAWQYGMSFSQLFTFILGFLMLKITKRTPLTFGKVIYTTLIFMFISLQPSYVKQLMDLLSCRQISEDDYMAANVAFKCYTRQYFTYTLLFLLPGLGFFMVLVPGSMFLGLKRAYQKKQMHKIATRFKYGFLYNEYIDTAYFWEFVKIFEKVLITIIISFYEEHIVVKGTLVFLVIMAYASLARTYTPYFKKNLNELDQQSTAICSVSIVLGVFLFENKFDYWIWLGYGIIAILNAYFVCRMLHAIIYKYIANVEQKLVEKAKKIKCLKKIQNQAAIDRKLLTKHFWQKTREHINIYVAQLKKGVVEPAYNGFLEQQRNLGNIPKLGEFNERPNAQIIMEELEREKEQMEAKVLEKINTKRRANGMDEIEEIADLSPDKKKVEKKQQVKIDMSKIQKEEESQLGSPGLEDHSPGLQLLQTPKTASRPSKGSRQQSRAQAKSKFQFQQQDSEENEFDNLEDKKSQISSQGKMLSLSDKNNSQDLL